MKNRLIHQQSTDVILLVLGDFFLCITFLNSRFNIKKHIDCTYYNKNKYEDSKILTPDEVLSCNKF